MMKDELRKIIEFWSAFVQKERNVLLPRESYSHAVSDKHALVYLGVRRSGKTVITCANAFQQVKQFFYMNFEDPFFITHSDIDVFELLLEVYIELYGHEPQLLAWDEIQNIPNWERWVRKTIDTRRYRLVLTGSSAKLLSSEIATALTGRTISRVVWPLSFSEFLRFHHYKPATDYEKLSRLKQYFSQGGFPAVVLEKDSTTRVELLKQYLQDILYKDIVARHQIRNVTALNQIVQYYLANLSSLHSYTRIKNAFSLNIETVQEYSAYLKEAFLFFPVQRYHPNLKTQARDPFKLYTVDTGLRTANAFAMTPDIGKLAENVVFIELKRRGSDVYYFKEDLEVDFILRENNQATGAIQVCYDNLSAPETYRREVNGLLSALHALHLSEGLILTENRLETLTLENKKIRMIPMFRWLLGK
jgi:hypothetical protein